MHITSISQIVDFAYAYSLGGVKTDSKTTECIWLYLMWWGAKFSESNSGLGCLYKGVTGWE